MSLVRLALRQALLFSYFFALFTRVGDENTLWQIKPSLGSQDCPRGNPVACDQVVRFWHVQTSHFLHSHLHKSPIEKTRSQRLSTWRHWRQLSCRLQQRGYRVEKGFFYSTSACRHRHAFRCPWPHSCRIEYFACFLRGLCAFSFRKFLVCNHAKQIYPKKLPRLPHSRASRSLLQTPKSRF